MLRPSTPTADRRGFTLIELLVVISIIALLIAILLPALQAARATALKITCRSNIRQVHLATVMYTEDFDRFFPHYRTYAFNDLGQHGSHLAAGKYFSLGSNVQHCPADGDDTLYRISPAGQFAAGTGFSGAEGLGPSFYIYSREHRLNPNTWNDSQTPANGIIRTFDMLTNDSGLYADRYWKTTGVDTSSIKHVDGVNVVRTDGSGYYFLDPDFELASHPTAPPATPWNRFKVLLGAKWVNDDPADTGDTPW